MSDPSTDQSAEAYASQVREGDQHYRALCLDDAMVAYERAAEIRPEGFEARLGLARTLTRMRRPEEAFAAAQALVDLDSGRWEGHACLGTLYFLGDRYDEAVQKLRQAIHLAPGEPESYFTLAQVYADLEQPSNARRALDEGREHLTELGEDAARSMAAFGLHSEIYMCLADGRQAEAVELAQRLVGMRDDNPHAAALAYSNLGILAANSRNLDQAVEYLEQAYAISSYLHLAGRTLGTILVVQHKYGRAAEVLSAVVESMPAPDGSTRYVYGLALANVKRRREAEEQFRLALQSGLKGTNRLAAWWQMVWQSAWGRYVVTAVFLAAAAAWLLFARPEPQTLVLAGCLVLFIVLQQRLQRRRR